ncbi:MAG: hypothetical protein RL217_1291 [Pseudomonadota bacterium]|jgi:cell division protein FtsB
MWARALLFKKWLWLFPTLLLLLVQYRIWFDDTGYLSRYALKKNISSLEQDNQVHQAENDALKAEVLALRQGTELLEEKAREELGLVKVGESFVLFVDKK